MLASRSFRVFPITGQLWRAILWSGIATAIIFALVYVLGKHDLTWEAPDRFTYDWRAALYSEVPPETRTDIALVLISDDSLARYYSRSPVDRGLIAELIRAVDAAGPKGIGLDFIFDRRSEPCKNDALLKSIREAKSQVILGLTTGKEGPVSQENLEIQEDFIRGTGQPQPRPAGTLFFGEHEDWVTLGDDVVRTMGAPIGNRSNSKPFDLLLAEIAGAKEMPSNRLIDWLLRPKEGKYDTFATIYVPPHEPVDGLGDGSELLPKAITSVFKNKVVIIGGDFIDRDQHLIPLSIETKARVPGAFIHAQIVAQLIDGRMITELPRIYEVPIVFMVCFVSYLISARYFLFGIELFSHSIFLLVIILIGAIFFYKARIVLPTSTMASGWILGAIGGDHYDKFANPIICLLNEISVGLTKVGCALQRKCWAALNEVRHLAGRNRSR